MTDVQDKLGQTATGLADEAAKMRAVINSTDVPTLEAPPSPVQDLLIGVVVDGVHYKQALVREITGADEEELSKVDREEDADGYSFLLETATTKLRSADGAEIDAKEHIKKLTIGDRDALFLAIVIATYGEVRTIGAVCPHCGAKLDVTMLLNEEFEVTPVPPTMRPDGTVSTTIRGGILVEMRYLTGEAQTKAWRAVTDKENIPMYNTAVIAECLARVNSVAVPEGARYPWARELGMADRRSLFELIEDAPGPKITTVSTDCGECSKPLVVRLDWGRLLYG